MFIVGPCSAETETQLLATARAVAALMPDSFEQVIFRAGVWKPRTSPDSFQGAGMVALKWLNRVQTECGLPVAVEVATPEHVSAALAAGVDYLWIGARTGANPIAVQAVAEAVIQSPVQPRGLMIKNPVNADAMLWKGNIERLERTSVPVIAVHRGCNHRPCWQMAYELRSARPDIPLLIDPCHMSGDKNLVEGLCRMAQTLGYDGTMIEVHCAPQTALSDARQQLTPDEWGALVRKYPFRPVCDDHTLAWLRAMMDETDDNLWQVIEERMKISRRIGEWKQLHDVPVLQRERFNEIVERRQEWALSHAISPDTVDAIL
ncbi:MAG: bifunctional 3-deoxy-7-phosphoheptulonate synthase/chorismate mutase type II, partial [Paludibacteraceae bacterium]|nr:bifunctional 3-deoxy-7-phosphoheptulonate synthase/chorismate mutase type II [Paludibacteraceae bacterium]